MPLFPRWSNRVARFIGAFALLAPVVAVGAALILARTPLATRAGTVIAQPVAFDHSRHAQLDCRYCHATVDNAAAAGLPQTERCMGCHAHAWSGSPKLDALRTGGTVNWARVNALPDFVYFDHSAHAAKGVACGTCHGAVEKMSVVTQTSPLSMEWCIECHKSSSTQPDVHARTTCDACHR